VSRQFVSLIRVVALGMAAGLISGQAAAEVRADVVERIKPVGKVTVEGQAQPAAASAPAAAAPVAAVAPAEAPAASVAAAEPAKPAAPAEPAEPAEAHPGEAVYQKACIACHLSGAANAPKLGDKAAWEPRIAKGNDALYGSALNGLAGTAMAPRGTCAACTDDELKQAVDFMVSKAK
jgi:cytochrome c5